MLWKTYTIEEPKPRGKNKDGVQQWGPAGGGIWSSPTVDPKRGMVYVATGNNYADPSQKTTDAVIALDMKSGTVKWVNQTTPNDNWTLGCRPENPDNPNCPAKLGPDHDFSASPSLATVNGRDLLVLPQKSGMAYALDPDKEGEMVWQLPHRPGQRARRPVGRRGRRAASLLRRVRSAVAEAGRHSRRQPRHGRAGVERRAAEAAVRPEAAAPAARRRARRSP